MRKRPQRGPDISSRDYPYAKTVGKYLYRGEMRIEGMRLLMAQYNNAGKVVDVVRTDTTTDQSQRVEEVAIVGEVYGVDANECYEKTKAAADAWCVNDARAHGEMASPDDDDD